MKKSFLFAIFAISILFVHAQGDFRDMTLPVEKRVELLMEQLTLDEKLSMLEHSNPAIERLGIPAYSWWNEALHGVARNGFATVYPMPIALAATFDDKAVYEMFGLVGDEARMKYFQSQNESKYGDNTGLTFFAPNINIFRDPRWGRGMETYGEDPYLTARMGEACVKGLQQHENGRYKTLACIKHFAVHSGPEADRHSFDAKVDKKTLWTTYLPAFEYIVKKTDVSMVMCGYNRLNGIPCCTNNDLLVKILRDKWGYEGLFVTDCWALNDCWERDPKIPRHETHETAAGAATDAFGSVIDLECGSGLNALKDAVKQNLISEDVINYHVFKVLRAKFLLGLFDHIPPFNKQIDNKKFDDKALIMAEKSIVLLKNNGILPIDVKKYKKIAIVGPNAADSAMLSGNYNGTPKHTVTIYEGIKYFVNNLPKQEQPTIIFDTLCHHVDNNYIASNAFYKQMENCDLVIFAGGLSPELEGEQLDVELEGFHGGDRTNIELPAVQKEILVKLKSLGKPVVLVLCSGGAIALDWENENLDGILEAWYGGQAAGTAVSNVLFGKTNPSGKLPVTFYSSKNNLPPFENYDMKNRTYRFMTEKPLFPFGYGLSYTKFEYSNPKFDKKNKVFSVDVTNVGEISGEDTPLLYITNNNDETGPFKSLAGFQKVNLDKGETKRVYFTVEDRFFETFIVEIDDFKFVSSEFEFSMEGLNMKVRL